MPNLGTTGKHQVITWQPYFNPDGSAVSGALATPAAPTLSTLTTGGSIPAGTYLAGLTYTNALGETVVSPTTAQVVPAGTSTNTITTGVITPPAGATSVRYYLSQAGGSILYYSGTNSGAAYTYAAVPATSAAQPPAANSTGPVTTLSTYGRNYVSNKNFKTANTTTYSEALAGYDTFIGTVGDGTSTLEVMYQVGNTALWNVLEPGTTGVLKVYREGNATGNPVETVSGIITKRDMTAPYDNMAMLSVGWQLSGAPVYGVAP